MIKDNSTTIFFKLPYELRLRIYETFLLADSEITIAANHPRFEGHIETSLLRTCNLIYNEGAEVLYGSNIFEALLQRKGPLATRHLTEWLHTIHERNVARLNRLKCSVRFQIPAFKPPTTTLYSSALFHVEVTFKLRKNPSWSYVAEFQALGSSWNVKNPMPPPLMIPLAKDRKVEEQLEMKFRSKGVSKRPWGAKDIEVVVGAVAEIRPLPGKEVDVLKLPDGAVALINQQAKLGSWDQANRGYATTRRMYGRSSLP